MPKILAGVMPPMITPFAHDELDIKAHKANIHLWNQTGLSGYLVLGSNGEAIFLTDEEKDQLLAATIETATPDKVIMAGTGAESTRATIKLTRRAAELGADYALIITPAYFKSQMTPARLKAHYQQVADEVPIPILLYNFPQSTGLNLSPETVAVLAEHPNIVGIKDSSGNVGQMIEICQMVPPEFAVFVGNAGVFYPALCVGAVGAILAVANALPEVCVTLWNHYRHNDHAASLRLQRAITRLAAMVTVIHGIGGLKAAMALVGYEPGQVRSPLTMPTPEVINELQAELEKIKP